MDFAANRTVTGNHVIMAVITQQEFAGPSAILRKIAVPQPVLGERIVPTVVLYIPTTAIRIVMPRTAAVTLKVL